MVGALNFGFSWVGTVGRDGNRRREALSERCAHGEDREAQNARVDFVSPGA